MRRVQEFVDDPEATSLAFEPMDAKGRYIVAEEASEFSGLTDITEGEMLDEKHVVLYKAGHVPEDDCPPTRLASVAADPSAHSGPASEAPAPRRAKAAAPKPPADELRVLNTVKRDRRTIEEIQRERKKLRGAEH
mmetsp:Transcript_96304/g.274388  ORF Transcript_96304/g.274388 Transcript_96304/m.274388 type:complete len:135 (-) Transcript_96304:248-652(-)